MTYDDNDLASMALCVWREARGEGELGMKAVADVIANRAKAWYSHLPEPVHAAVYARNQFTSMSVPSDPEFNLEPKPGDAQFAFCQSICKPILDGQMSDVTNNALYYCNPKEATSGWFFDHIVADSLNHPQVATIGRQFFYR
jgi:spore germination cell wall hydrolase CwlJ-like protein